LAYLDNVLARASAREAGADEALMLNTRGEVACAAAANIFWLKEGLVHTPDLDCGVLDGVIRAWVLAMCRNLGQPAAEVRMPLAALADAEAIFLTNSLMGVRAVSRLDGAPIGAWPLLGQLAAQFAKAGISPAF